MTTLHHTFRSMASDVTINITDPLIDLSEKIQEAIEVFSSLEHSCTRFNSTSPLMQANAEPNRWHKLPTIALEVIRAAYEAYQMTEGIFDPRILGDLLKNGYDDNIRFDSVWSANNASIENSQVNTLSDRGLGTWHPEFSADGVLLGDLPIDLGGIGKGFAVQRAMEILQDGAEGVLINAGGDIAAEGFNVDGNPWRLGVENPWNPEGEPVIVVELVDASIATSSVRLRSWTQDGKPKHHLIDPTTGSPGGDGLVAVSVIAPSTSIAEVWSKTLFLSGLPKIDKIAAHNQIAASWIDGNGNVFSNNEFQDQVIWAIAKAPINK